MTGVQTWCSSDLMFYQKLPSRMILAKNLRKEARDKNRATMMICSSAVGHKIRLTMVGKADKPRCFKLLPKKYKTPLPYAHQAKAWFDGKVFKWWIFNVFIPDYKKEHDEQNGFLF